MNLFQELCRLCGKKEDFSKDFLDKDNKNLLEIVRDLLQIVVSEDDGLPRNICLYCEEKIVSFQLYSLECHKIQDTLKKALININDIKIEDHTEKSYLAVKLEVKDEYSAEDIVSAINEIHSNYDDEDFQNDNDDDDDELDNMTIASLKEIKGKKNEKVLSGYELEEFIKRPHLKVKDFVSYICDVCGKVEKTWNSLNLHCYKVHQMKTTVYCICGCILTTKTLLHKHVRGHKKEGLKLRRQDGEEINKDNSRADTNKFVRFACNTCGREHSSWYKLQSHCRRMHKIDPVVTCSCGVMIKSKSVLYTHVKHHYDPNAYSCDKCPRITKSKTALDNHKLKHVPKDERKFSCASCDKVFNSKDLLRSHLRSHIPLQERKVFDCDYCSLKFTTRSSAAAHLRVVHEKVKKFVCDLCGYACGTSGELRQHRAIHSDDKPYACNKCTKQFKTYSNLKTHLDTHADTSYACYVCNRVLNSRRTLRKHLLVHEDKCMHVCSYCNKAFKRRQTLKVHMHMHTGDKPLSCKWCSERFSYASTLRSHRIRCHPDKQDNTYAPYPHMDHHTQDLMKNDTCTISVTIDPKNVIKIMPIS